MAEETAPLISKADSIKVAVSGKQSHAVKVQEDGQNAERVWDGPLWKMCGDCDQAGLSTFAYVKMCTPFAFGHNLQRAFGKGFWVHAIIFTLLFCTWGYAFMGSSSRVNEACGLPHPPVHRPDGMHPAEPKLPALHTDPEQQQFLTGATFNPDFAGKEGGPEGTNVWVTVEGSDLIDNEADKENEAPTKAPGDERVSLDQDVLQQLQNAKLQAAEGMANLGIGRKMLHKHSHNDSDDDHEHKPKKDKKHKHDDKDDDHHKDKKHPKKHDKEGKEDFGGPKDKMIDGPPHGLESPECHDATVSMGALAVAMIFSSIVGIAYATKLRTAIRKQHNIKGTKCQDCLAWTFCAPCALCQETRTLAKNNVHNGVWHGPFVLPEAAQQPLVAPTPVEAPTKPV